MELRMYGLVNYQLTGIQKGIQFGHAVVDYSQSIRKSENSIELEKYNEWADNHKTFIILSGGTTNLSIEKPGTMNLHLKALIDNNIYCRSFHEPDLGDQLTAISFIVDERVFNKEKYPDYQFQLKQADILSPKFICDEEKEDWIKWVHSIGGQSNLFLRTFLTNFRLA